MEVVRQKLREEKGDIALRGAVFIILAAMVVVMILESFHVYATITDLKNKTNEAVLAAASANVSSFFRGARESDGNARQYIGSTWTANVDPSQVMPQLALATGGQVTSSGGLLKDKSYQITNLITTYTNTDGSALSFRTTLTLEIFLNMGVSHITIPFDLEVKTTYAAKF